jgi:hypothetical protein
MPTSNDETYATASPWANYVRGPIVICLCVVAITFLAAAQDVLTWHNDNARTGQTLDEKVLTLQN